jgi:cation:H+ antiporter
MMVASMLLLWLFSFTKLTVARWEGAVLTAVYLGYLAWLLYNV